MCKDNIVCYPHNNQINKKCNTEYQSALQLCRTNITTQKYKYCKDIDKENKHCPKEKYQKDTDSHNSH